MYIPCVGDDITVDGAIAVLEAALANGVCQEMIINDIYNSNDRVKELMRILEERKRQEVARKYYCMIITYYYCHNNRIAL